MQKTQVNRLLATLGRSSHPRVQESRKRIIRTLQAAGILRKPPSTTAAAAAPASSPKGASTPRAAAAVQAKYEPTIGDARRDHCAGLLFDALRVHAAQSHTAILQEAAERLEAAVFASLTGESYLEQVKTLRYNLKQNSELTLLLLYEKEAPEDVALRPSSELATKDLQKERRKVAEREMQAKQGDWRENTLQDVRKELGVTGGGLHNCRFCRSNNTIYNEKQTRGGDEPMTTFLYCLDCRKHDKF